MDKLGLGITAPTLEHAKRLAAAIEQDFDVEIRSGGSYTVYVKPGVDASERLVLLFNSIGTWLTEGGLASCDVHFDDHGLTILPATAENLGDPTGFLIERTRQLETALVSRIVIEQAKGILAERNGIGVEEAFERLRHEARSARRKIHEVAADVVNGQAQL